MATYYFDGSDAGATDPNARWTNDANAFDSDATPSTFATSTSIGSTSANYLMAEGTNAPTSGNPIDSVRARMFSGDTAATAGVEIDATIYTNGLAESLGTIQNITTSTGVWSNYITLSTPSGGWTWQTVNDLEVKIYPITLPLTTGKVFKVEVEVTESILDLVSSNFYLKQGFQ